MGDIPYITTLCLNGTLPCVDFMDVIMADIPDITKAKMEIPSWCVLDKSVFQPWQSSCLQGPVSISTTDCPTGRRTILPCYLSIAE